MKNKLTFLYDNLFDDATVTASTEATGYPVANAQNPIRTLAWRSTTDDDYIDIDLGIANEYYDTVAFVYWNIGLDCTITIQANDTNAFATPAFELEYDVADLYEVNLFGDGLFGDGLFGGAVESYRNTQEPLVIDLGQLLQCRYIRITFNDTTLTYISVGRVFLTQRYVSQAYLTYPFALQFDDPSDIETGDSGIEWVNTKDPFYSVELNLQKMDESELYSRFMKMINTVGKNKSFIMLADPSDYHGIVNNSFYGRFTEIQTIQNISIDHVDMRIVFKEVY